MAIPEGHKANLETIKRAAANGDLALMETTDRATGKPVFVLCAVSPCDGEYEFTPLAKMFDGNPYEELNPPNLPEK